MKIKAKPKREDLIPIKPIRGVKDGKEVIKFINEEYTNLPENTQTIEEYKRINPPNISCNADYEKILKKYLESTFLKSCDDDAEFSGRLSLHEFQYSYARDTCKNLGFMAGSRITDKGVEFLKYLQQKEILEKQSRINKYLTFATIFLAIGTLFQIFILLFK